MGTPLCWSYGCAHHELMIRLWWNLFNTEVLVKEVKMCSTITLKISHTVQLKAPVHLFVLPPSLLQLSVS